MSYIVVEGLDFSGKSTLCQKLADTYKSRLVAEPFGESLVSSEIRRLIRGAQLEHAYETQLLIASRIELFSKVGLYAATSSSTYLISDRSFLTNIVYQSQTEIDMKRIMNLNINTLEQYGFDIIPDLIIYAEVPYEVACSRLEETKRTELNALDKKVMLPHTYEVMQKKYRQAIDMILERNPKTKVLTVTHETPFEDVVSWVDDQMKFIDSIKVSKKVPVTAN